MAFFKTVYKDGLLALILYQLLKGGDSDELTGNLLI